MKEKKKAFKLLKIEPRQILFNFNVAFLDKKMSSKKPLLSVIVQKTMTYFEGK